MSFTIDWVDEVSFQPCFGWPSSQAIFANLPADTSVFAIVNGHFQSSLTGEMKLDNFTGYVTITSGQIRATGDSEDHAERQAETEKNREKVLLAFQEYKKVKPAFLYAGENKFRVVEPAIILGDDSSTWVID